MPNVRYHLMKGIQKLRAGKDNQARKHLNRIPHDLSKQNENLARVYYRLTKCYSRLKDVDGFLSSFVNYIEHDNKKHLQRLNKHCKSNIIEMYYNTNKPSKLDLFKLLYENFPDDAEICLYYGVAKIEIEHNYQEGKQLIDNAFECKTDNISWLYVVKGAVLYDYFNNKEEGLKYLRKAVELKRNPINLATYAYRLSESDYTSAYNIYWELYQTQQTVDILSGLAACCMRAGNFKDGLEAAFMVYDVVPSDVKNLLWLAYGFSHLGKYKKAIKIYKKCDKLSPYYKKYIYESITECYEEMGDEKNAQVYARKAIELVEEKLPVPVYSKM